MRDIMIFILFSFVFLLFIFLSIDRNKDTIRLKIIEKNINKIMLKLEIDG